MIPTYRCLLCGGCNACKARSTRSGRMPSNSRFCIKADTAPSGKCGRQRQEPSDDDSKV